MTLKLAVIFGGTTAVVLVEWLMFELLRTPYRPPEDMRTLLGVEKYQLLVFMIMVAVTWTLVVLCVFATEKSTRRERRGFLALLAVLPAMLLYIILVPHRPVTPWEIILY